MIDGSWALEYAAILMLDSPDRPLPLRAVISSGEKVASALLCDLDRATLNHRFSQSMEIKQKNMPVLTGDQGLWSRLGEARHCHVYPIFSIASRSNGGPLQDRNLNLLHRVFEDVTGSPDCL